MYLLDGSDVLMQYRTIIGCCEGDSVPQIFIPRLVQLYREGNKGCCRDG